MHPVHLESDSFFWHCVVLLISLISFNEDNSFDSVVFFDQLEALSVSTTLLGQMVFVELNIKDIFIASVAPVLCD